jgi:hypothetical protein
MELSELRRCPDATQQNGKYSPVHCSGVHTELKGAGSASIFYFYIYFLQVDLLHQAGGKECSSAPFFKKKIILRFSCRGGAMPGLLL